MHIRVDRDVLYFESLLFNSVKNLQCADAPRRLMKNQNRGYPHLLFSKGSLTVEASFAATIFFLALFSLLYLFQMLLSVNQIQMCLATAVQEYECFGTKLSSMEALITNSCLVQWDEEQGICYVTDSESIPFLGSRFLHVSLYQQMKINDYSGKSMISQNTDAQIYVYITENGKVYHRDKGCVYLNPDIQRTSYQNMEKQRNRSGGKYKICKSCGSTEEYKENTIVYITPYGERFHISRSCSGLKRTVRKVELDKIGNMPACSKCAGG